MKDNKEQLHFGNCTFGLSISNCLDGTNMLFRHSLTKFEMRGVEMKEIFGFPSPFMTQDKDAT